VLPKKHLKRIRGEKMRKIGINMFGEETNFGDRLEKTCPIGENIPKFVPRTAPLMGEVVPVSGSRMAAPFAGRTYGIGPRTPMTTARPTGISPMGTTQICEDYLSTAQYYLDLYYSTGNQYYLCQHYLWMARYEYCMWDYTGIQQYYDAYLWYINQYWNC